MNSCFWLIFFTKILSLSGQRTYENKTFARSIVTNEIDDGWEVDPYMEEAQETCSAGVISGCLRRSAMSSLSSFFDRKLYTITDEAKFVRTELVSDKKVKFEGFDFSEEPRSGQSQWEAAIGFLARRAERFIKTTAFEVELTPEMTENGKYQPRFVDEIYSEIDRLEDKNDKPEKRYEIKKLFIPLLVILKMFKLKLLFLLPFILGLVSFKKVFGILIFLVPGIIGYLKFCKPDISSSYGNFGHSSYYKSPPINGEGFHDRQEAMKIAYHGYRN